MINVIAANLPSEKLLVMNDRINMLNGRRLLKRTARFGLIAGIAFSVVDELSASSDPVRATSALEPSKAAVIANPLKPPVQGSIPIAFLISDGAVIIDFCGPWEVFRDVNIPGRDHPFRLYTVAET